jgi:hypothetical protein
MIADWAYTAPRCSKILQIDQFAILTRRRTFSAKTVSKSQTLHTRLTFNQDQPIYFNTYLVRRVAGSQKDPSKSRNSTNELAILSFLLELQSKDAFGEGGQHCVGSTCVRGKSDIVRNGVHHYACSLRACSLEPVASDLVA